MNTKKTEEALTRLYQRLLKLKLSEHEKGELRLFAFLYTVGRVNPLQAVAKMSYIAKKHRLKLKELDDLLSDIWEKVVK